MSRLSISDAALEAGDRVGLIVGDESLSFAALAERAAAVDIAPTLVADRSVDTAVAIYAALERRMPLVLIHPRLTAAERARLPRLDALPDGGAFALFTSGSTGAPKAVVLSRANLLAAADASAARLGWCDGDRWLCPIPLAHVGGLSVLSRCLIARQWEVLGDLDDLRRHRATIASVVPTQLARLAEARCPPHLRIALVGGARLHGPVRDRAVAAGYPVRATYGMTEACSQVATQAASDEPGVGRPLDGLEVDATGGRIRVRGPSVMLGYAGATSGLDDDGWLDTGDLGHVDDRGFLHVTGRADDLIVTGGENVHPSEVEDALTALADIDAACVFGVPDDEWGAVVAAAVVAPAPPDDAALSAHLRAVLAPFKLPRRLCYVDDLARSASGKVDRRATMRAALAHLRPLR